MRRFLFLAVLPAIALAGDFVTNPANMLFPDKAQGALCPYAISAPQKCWTYLNANALKQAALDLRDATTALQSHTSGWVNAAEYGYLKPSGVYGDGTSDTVAVQAAANLAAGKPVLIPAGGTYSIGALTLPAGVVLEDWTSGSPAFYVGQGGTYKAMFAAQPGYVAIAGTKVATGTAAPASGTWAQGDRVLNSAPSPSSPRSWMCTAGGTPGTWLAEGQQYAVKTTTAQSTTDNSGLTAVSGLTFPIVSGGAYTFEFELITTTAATSTGLQIAVTGPAGSTQFVYGFEQWTTGSSVVFSPGYNANAVTGITNSWPAANSQLTNRVRGTIYGAAQGTVGISFRSGVNGSAVTVYPGSNVRWQQIQ